MEKSRSIGVWKLLGILQMLLIGASILITVLSFGVKGGIGLRLWAQAISMILIGFSFFIILYVPFHSLWHGETFHVLILALQVPVLILALCCLVLILAGNILRFA